MRTKAAKRWKISGRSGRWLDISSGQINIRRVGASSSASAKKGCTTEQSTCSSNKSNLPHCQPQSLLRTGTVALIIKSTVLQPDICLCLSSKLFCCRNISIPCLFVELCGLHHLHHLLAVYSKGFTLVPLYAGRVVFWKVNCCLLVKSVPLTLCL